MDQKRRRWIIILIFLIIICAIFIFLENSYTSDFKSKMRAVSGIRPSDLKWYRDVLESQTRCQMNSCFDYSRCTPSSGFQVFVYGMELLRNPLKHNNHMYSHVLHVINQSPYMTKTPERACVFLVIVAETSSDMEARLYSLRYWNGDGNNHILLNIADSLDNIDIFAGVDTGKAMIAQTSFIKTMFSDQFDFIIPPDFGKWNVPSWTELPQLLPIRRRYFLSFYGAFCSKLTTYNTVTSLGHQLKNSTGSTLQGGSKTTTRTIKQTNTLPETIARKGDKSYLESIPASDTPIVESLMKLQEKLNENIYINLTCDTSRYNVLVSEWCLCGDKLVRSDILNNSKFSVILSSASLSSVSTMVFQTRLFESLKFGAVPVILGDNVVLPYNELLDWSKAVVFLPKARAAYIHTYLSALGDNDILAMKMVGRMFWERYFGSTSSIIETTLAVLRGRLLIPPITIKDERSDNIQIAKPQRIKQKSSSSTIVTDKVQVTVHNQQLPLIYQHNFGTDTLRGLFNTPGDPFHLYPFNPFQHSMSPDIQLKDKDTTSHLKESVMKKKAKGSLTENHRKEEFTVVILTYKTKRIDMLKGLIVSLKDCPYLNKVVVVWNNPSASPEKLTLPEIDVPVIALKMPKNSLNNRFLPFDVIETEAVLSADDDMSMTHEEIVFGFKVWRENRDRMVGYPGWAHEWNKKNNRWQYKTFWSCDISMVLTGQAFFNKYYAYLYSYVMPQAIRDQVDKTMNCEDIALNFLVAHITRKPPVKVTAKNVFYDGAGLSKNGKFLEGRHQCIDLFVKVYGYMPLLLSHYRADYVENNVKVKSRALNCK